MKSKWYVACNPIGGKPHYIAMRTLDTSKVDRLGNIEIFGYYSRNRDEIKRIVNKLNKEEDK